MAEITGGRASSAANRCWTSLQVKLISPDDDEWAGPFGAGGHDQEGVGEHGQGGQRYQERQRRT